MTESNSSTGGFIKGQFENCPKCGELVHTSAPGCRHCGWSRTEEVLSLTDTPETSQQTYHHQPVYQPPPELQQNYPPGTIPPPDEHTTCYTPDGLAIPPEYPINFNPYSFSWAAFWFADLWHAEKGLLPQARKHAAQRLATSLCLAMALGIMFTVSDVNDPGAASTGIFVGLLMLAWFGGLITCLAVSASDARLAHNRYISQYNNLIKSDKFENMRKLSMKTYWSILYVPFGMFTVAFIMMLLVVSVAGN